jgi:predicted nucleic acid-binding Zn ribbon protein
MSLVNNISKKLRKTTQSVVKGTKDFTDIARLNSQIADERQQIENLYIQIGKIYHETQGADEHSPSGKLCMSIEAANTRITQYEQDILTIKGVRKCTVCGAKTPANAVFCSSCGAKTEIPLTVPPPPVPEQPIKKCTGCGTVLPDEVAFCTACGHKAVNGEDNTYDEP